MTAAVSRRTVSVIIPAYNRAALLPRAIDSVLSQTRKPDEIIVVDDGSTDATPDLLRHYGSRIRVLRQPNAGVSAARNLGIKHATGDWIGFLDSDDAWLPDKLARQLRDIVPGHKIGYTDEIWIRHGRRVNPRKRHAKAGGHIFERCLPLCIISPSSVLIDRSLFRTTGCFDEALPACEDYDLWLRICARFPVSFLNEPLIVKYGGHTDQLSRRYWGMDRFRIRALEKIVSDTTVNDEYRRAALRTLVEKLDIYGSGARKRGKVEEGQVCADKRAYFLELLMAS